MPLIDHKIIIAYQNEILNSPTLTDKEKIEMIKRANNAAVSVSNAELLPQNDEA